MSESLLRQRWEAFCRKHAIDNADVRIDDVDGQIVLHAGMVVSDAVRSFSDPDYLKHCLAEEGLELLRYDVQDERASMAVTTL